MKKAFHEVIHLQAVLDGRQDDAAVADIAISGVAGWVFIAAPEGGRIVIRVFEPVGACRH